MRITRLITAKNNEIMKLELKHLAPYLPYGLKIYVDNDKRDHVKPYSYNLTIGYFQEVLNSEDKPILRPLSDLTKNRDYLIDLRDLENNDMLFWGVHNFNGDLTKSVNYSDDLTYSVLEFLYKNHFDVFGLIEKGLAIDINTIK